jgi:uncharacterized damage-inducible protein DinB
MLKEGLLGDLNSSREFFLRATDCLTEEDSKYTPSRDMYTVSQMVAHVAQSIDWFIDGALISKSGFSMDFDEHIGLAKAVSSLNEARKWLDQAYTAAIDMVNSKSDEELLSPLPDGPIMGGLPKSAVIGAISEHTAHHRGSLSVYSRLIGKTPKMPYGDI